MLLGDSLNLSKVKKGSMLVSNGDGAYRRRSLVDKPMGEGLATGDDLGRLNVQPLVQITATNLGNTLAGSIGDHKHRHATGLG